MLNIKILPVANEEIRLSAICYNQKQTNLGLRFVAEVRDKLNFIKKIQRHLK
jgi:hypothetical protein